MAVITISRQYGSGGDEIVELICKTTGYQIFDKHIIAAAAVEAGLSDQEVIDFAEGNYKVKNFLDRLLGISRPVAQLRVWKENSSGERTAEEMPLNEENALALVKKAIEYAYNLGNMVIVGRGGQVVLRDCPDVLHVRVEAPLEDRILRVRTSPIPINRPYQDSVKTRRAAQDVIAINDAASADYLKRFYGVDWADPLLYHLLINTSKLQVEPAAQVIIEAARQLEQVAVFV